MELLTSLWHEYFQQGNSALLKPNTTTMNIEEMTELRALEHILNEVELQIENKTNIIEAKTLLEAIKIAEKTCENLY